MSESKLLLAGDHLALLFPYIPEQIRELKTIDGAKWDKLSKTWRLPMRSINETLTFARKHGFDIDTDLTDLQLPPRPHAESRLDLDGDTIYIRFPYDEVKIASIGKVPGTVWDSKAVVWKAALPAVVAVTEWADEWHLEVPEEIRQAALDVAAAHSELHGLSMQTSLGTPLDIPALALDLYPFQHVGVQYALDTRRTFIADQMGLGKTAQAIAALEAGGGFPAVVVAPPSLILNWAYEIHAWLPDKKVSTLSGMAKPGFVKEVLRSTPSENCWQELRDSTGLRNPTPTVNTKTPPDYIMGLLLNSDVIIVGYATLGAWLPVLQLFAKSVVFDESQYIKSPSAQRTKAAVKLTKGLSGDAMVLCLTGTPVASRPAEYAAQLKVMGRLDEFGGEYAFYKRYCAAYKDKFGHFVKDGHSNMEELNEKLRATCYVRRLKRDVLPDLAEKRSVPVWVEGDPAVMKEYYKAEADIVTYMANRAKEIALELGTNPRSAAVQARIKTESAEHLVRIAALRRIAAKAKLGAVRELVASHLEEGSKVVLAAHHRDIVTGLADEFGGYKIIGGQPVEETEAAKKAFQTDPEVSVIVLSVQAAKTGHTLTAAQDIILVELPWTPSDFDQVVDRIHRIGQTGSVLATSVLVPSTIDEDLWVLLAEKRKVVDAVTDGTPIVDDSSSVGDLLFKYALKGL